MLRGDRLCGNREKGASGSSEPPLVWGAGIQMLLPVGTPLFCLLPPPEPPCLLFGAGDGGGWGGVGGGGHLLFPEVRSLRLVPSYPAVGTFLTCFIQ